MASRLIHFVVALPAEAKPIVSHFRLKPIDLESPFKLYASENRFLIVSGTGERRSAEAVRFLHSFTSRPSAVLNGEREEGIWLNVGIGGHATRDLGEGVLANKVTRQTDGKSWYPPRVFDAPCSTGSILTVARAEHSYPGDWIYDMEAAGFYNVAARFSTSELIQCFKVISDNRTSSSRLVSAKLITQWIERAMPVVEHLEQVLFHLAGTLPSQALNPPRLGEFLDRWHFTVTETRKLKRLLARRAVLAAQPEFGIREFLKDHSERLPKQARDVLGCLESDISSVFLKPIVAVRRQLVVTPCPVSKKGEKSVLT